MKRGRFAKILAIILALLLLFSLIYGVIGSLTAGAVATQAEIDALKQQKQEYTKKKQEIQSRINTIEFERMTQVAKKQVLDDRIALTGLEIDNLNDTIANYVKLISEKEVEVSEAQAREDARLVDYKARVRDMEENGVISYLEIIFDSTSFSDLLARIDFIGDIMRADETAYNNLVIARNETIAAKEGLEKSKGEMEAELVDLKSTQDELAGQVDEANALISQIEDNLDTENDLYLSTIAEEQQVQNDINQKVEELKREQERMSAEAQAKISSGSGVLMWPTSVHTVTSAYGTRLHPVFRVYRKHWGIDIGASYGSNIVAADAGTVITSEYNSSYGNYVVISHGKGMTTLYAHMSARKVSVGDSVGKGQLIGLVGSTGVSTGPHLHFEVSINGSRVNPLSYLP